jgi:hypothetical protein
MSLFLDIFVLCLLVSSHGGVLAELHARERRILIHLAQLLYFYISSSSSSSATVGLFLRCTLSPFSEGLRYIPCSEIMSVMFWLVSCQVFNLTGRKKNVIAGCVVNSGSLHRKALFKVVRRGNVVHEGRCLCTRTESTHLHTVYPNEYAGFLPVCDVCALFPCNNRDIEFIKAAQGRHFTGRQWIGMRCVVLTL